LETLTTFDSTKESLQDLLSGIAKGKTQLPDFQRGWVWDDEHIRSLLASVSLSYPIGAVMMLQEGGAAQFKPRPVEGARVAAELVPERLVLDGQQRLTSLFQSLGVDRPVQTRDSRGKPLARWYYLDINKALAVNGDRDDAIVGIPEDRRIVSFRGQVLADYSSAEKECAAGLLPLSAIFDQQKLNAWMMTFVQLDPARVAERLNTWNDLMKEVISRFQQYQVPLILLRKETPKEAVCQVFEKVNTGGVSLTVFELLTATFAAENFHLRQDWEQRQRRFAGDTVLKGIENTDFLQTITLLATRARRQRAIEQGTPLEAAPGISCKRKDILRLTLGDYREWKDAAEEGFRRASKLMFSQKIFAARDLPYRTQLAPLAAIFAELGPKADQDGVRQRLLRWYWCGVFGELYGGAVETRLAKDLPEVLAWIDGAHEPSTITDATFAVSRLLRLRTRNSAAYKGVTALLMRDGGEDFRSGQPIDVARYFDDKVDIHHIFPQAWCQKNGVEPERCDSIVNKTPISAKTNRIIGGRAPSKYVQTVESQAGISTTRMDAILRTHVVDPDALRADDFDRFFASRMQTLMDRIQFATGKSAEQLAGGADTPEPAATEYEVLDEGDVITGSWEASASPGLSTDAKSLLNFAPQKKERRHGTDIGALVDSFNGLKPKELGSSKHGEG
jgi:hypothetical protein